MEQPVVPSSQSRPVQIHNGPIMHQGMAYLPPGADSQNTTPNVNYTAISEGKICAWFLGEVEALRQNDVAWPSYSHGFDPLLAVVHRDQPMLSYAYTDDATDAVTLYTIVHYESAGVWVDSSGYACLPIMAQFEDGTQEMRLLYSSMFRGHASLVDAETQWIRRPGRNMGA